METGTQYPHCAVSWPDCNKTDSLCFHVSTTLTGFRILSAYRSQGIRFPPLPRCTLLRVILVSHNYHVRHVCWFAKGISYFVLHLQDLFHFSPDSGYSLHISRNQVSPYTLLRVILVSHNYHVRHVCWFAKGISYFVLYLQDLFHFSADSLCLLVSTTRTGFRIFSAYL